MRASVKVNGFPLTRVTPHYSWVPESQVGALKAQLARRVVRFASSELAIPSRDIRWFEQLDEPAAEKAYDLGLDLFARPEEWVGEFDEDHPQRIGLNVKLEGDRLVKVVAHEMQHAAQFDNGRIRLMTDRESDAEGDRVGERLLKAWQALAIPAPADATKVAPAVRVGPDIFTLRRPAQRSGEYYDRLSFKTAVKPQTWFSSDARMWRAERGPWKRWGKTAEDAERNLERALEGG
jgi:hypothetical protein